MKIHQKSFSVIVTGIGGQGVLFLSKLLGMAASYSYPFVCRTESRGLSQRGGSVSCEVRFGCAALTPAVGMGTEDLVLSLDALEAARSRKFLKQTGSLITNSNFVCPAYLDKESNTSSDIEDSIRRELALSTSLYQIDLDHVTKGLGAGGALNVVLLGAASWHIPVPLKNFRRAILVLSGAVPRRNHLLFEAGRIAFEFSCLNSTPLNQAIPA